MIHLTARLSCPNDGSIIDPASAAARIAEMQGAAFAGVNTHLHMTVSAARAAKKAGVGFIPGYLDPGTGLVHLAGSDAAWRWVLAKSSGVSPSHAPDGLHTIIPCDHPIVGRLKVDPQGGFDSIVKLSREWGDSLSGEIAPGVGRFGDALRAAGVGMVAGNSARHMRQEDAFALEVYRCIGAGKTLSDFSRPRVETSDRWLCDVDWWSARAPTAYAREALRRTREIADACTFRLAPPNRPYMPKAPGVDDANRALAEAARSGLSGRGLASKQAYRDRLQHELKVIADLGWSDYFLVVDDFIRFAHQSSIPVGPGRGSGAGSLVAYALRITGIDPLPYGLFFERFLNPERVSIPDFDIDFCMNRRGEMVRYVEQTHGEDRVSQICTVGRLQLRAAIKDIGRVLGYSFKQINEATQGLPDPTDDEIKDIAGAVTDENVTLEDALAQFPDMLELPGLNPLGRHLFPAVKTLFKLPKSIGVHAAGVIISNCPLADVTAISMVEGKRVTQFDMDAADHMGLVKFDFLGLTTLTSIRRTAEIAGIEIDPERMQLDDPDVIHLFETGDTEHVFQFAGQSFARELKKMGPDRFEDLIAAAALYRPGPKEAGMLKDFIARKRGEQEVIPIDPRLEEVLRETLGVFVYQEQVMQAAQILAGYSLGAADLLRRAMGKKKVEAMAAERVKFVSGAVERGLTATRAGEIFDMIAEFAGYGFNKSHSAAYALIAYVTAWCRVYHPAAYAAAELETHWNKPKKIGPILRWIRSTGIEVRLPSVNGPIETCTDERGAVRMGLIVVKGIGLALVSAIVKARESGPFTSIEDFTSRVDSRMLGKDALTRIAEVGGFDDFEPHRAAAVARAGELGAYRPKVLLKNQPIFDIPPPIPPRSDIPDPWPIERILDVEHDVFGAYISGHPADAFLDHHQGLTSIDRISHLDHGDRVLVGGMVHDVFVYVPHNGRRTSGSFKLEGPGGKTISVKADGQTWGEIRGWVSEGALIVLSARVRRYSDIAVPELKAIGHDDGERTPVRPLESTDPILITVDGEPDNELRAGLREVLRVCGGKTPVIVDVEKNGKRERHTLKTGVRPWMKLDIQRMLPDCTIEHVIG